jgi:cytochrome c-type biogenesis protein CcmF
MTIHPPTLFLGFASTLVPFSYAIAGLLRRDYKSWINSALIWSFFSVGILGVGILMGGAWAYEALSFGGFWAWDPVENTSLVPWLTMAAGAHLLLVQKNKGGVIPSALFMLILTFLLVLYSTFLTRSGVLGDSSVHAFVDLGLSGQLLIYLLFFSIGSLVLLLARYKGLPKKEKEDRMDSREFWMFIGALTLLISGLQITLSTSYPVFNKLFGPEGLMTLYDKDKVLSDPIDHYNAIQVPFAIVIVLLIGAGQFLSYRKTSTALFFKRQILTLSATTLGTLLSAWSLKMWNPMYFLLLWASYYAIIGNLEFLIRWAKGNWNVAGSTVAHVGFGLIIAGSLVSNANKDVISKNKTFIHEEFPANENLLIHEGDTVQMGDYWVSWTGQEEEGYYLNYNLEFFKENEGKLEGSFNLKPRIQLNEKMGNVAEPSTKHFLSKDIYTHVTYADLRSELEKGDEEWKNQFDLELLQGESHFLYGKYKVQLDTLVVEAPSSDGELDYVVLGAGISVRTMQDSVYKIMPVYAVQGDKANHVDAEIEELGLKFRFERINYETNKPVISAAERTEEEEPFILIKAEVFPWINLLWLGSLMIAIGTFIAIVTRIRRS